MFQDILFSLRLSAVESTSLWLSALPSLWWVKNILIQQVIRLVWVDLLCTTPLLNSKILVSCIRCLLVVSCVVVPPMSGSTLLGLRRGSGCWWWLPSPSPMPRWEFFPVGFWCCPLRSFPCALVLQGLPPWGVVVQGDFWGDYFLFARYPLGQILIVSCRIPFPVLGGGGGRERKLLSIIIMHSCNPNDRLDLWILQSLLGEF